MLSYGYDFEQFIAGLKDKSFPEARRLTKSEVDIADVPIRGRTVDIRRRLRDKQRAIYADKVGGVLFFLRMGHRPDSLTENEFQMLLPLCEYWVKSGALLPTILDLFRR